MGQQVAVVDVVLDEARLGNVQDPGGQLWDFAMRTPDGKAEHITRRTVAGSPPVLVAVTPGQKRGWTSGRAVIEATRV